MTFEVNKCYQHVSCLDVVILPRTVQYLRPKGVEVGHTAVAMTVLYWNPKLGLFQGEAEKVIIPHSRAHLWKEVIA